MAACARPMSEPGGPFASGMLLWQVAKGYVSDAEISVQSDNNPRRVVFSTPGEFKAQVPEPHNVASPA